MLGTGVVTGLVEHDGVVVQPGPVKWPTFVTVATVVGLMVTEKLTVTVWPDGTPTVHLSVPVPDVTLHVAVAGRVVGHLAELVTKVVPTGAVSVTTSVPLAEPALWTLRL